MSLYNTIATTPGDKSAYHHRKVQFALGIPLHNLVATTVIDIAMVTVFAFSFPNCVRNTVDLDSHYRDFQNPCNTVLDLRTQ